MNSRAQAESAARGSSVVFAARGNSAVFTATGNPVVFTARDNPVVFAAAGNPATVGATGNGSVKAECAGALASDTGKTPYGRSVIPVEEKPAGAVAVASLTEPLLFIDASAPLVQVGLWQQGRWLGYRSADGAALESIFRHTDAVLKEAGITLGAVGGFIHNEGPGSVLGIRLAAMALRLWARPSLSHPVAGLAKADRPLFTVRSLPLVAAKMMAGGGISGDARTCSDISAGGATAGLAAPRFGVISEFRQGLWNWFEAGCGDVYGDSIEVIETEELAARLQKGLPCYYLRHRKSWAPPPGEVTEVDCDLSACAGVLALPGLLKRAITAEAFLTRPPEFKTATGERHRGAAGV